MLTSLIAFLRHSLAFKIYMYALIAFALLASLAFWALDVLVRESALTAIRQNIEARVAFIAREVGHIGLLGPGARSRLAELSNGMGVELHFVPWSHKGNFPAELDHQSMVVQQRSGASQHARHYWVRLERQGQPYGALSIRFRPFSPRHDSLPWTRELLFIAVLALVLIPPLIYWVIRPLGRLERAALRLGAGDLDAPITLARSDELGRVAAAFDYMRQQVKRMLHEKERLLIDVSHELRGPLSRMALAQTLLEEDIGGNPYVAQLRHEMARMDTLIGELLDLARGRVPSALQAEPLDLSKLTAELLAERRLVLDRGGYQLESTLQAAPSQGDPVLLRRALSNILDNALKYTPPDGRLQVSTGLDNGSAYYCIADNGPGIPEEAQAHIFEPFYRPDIDRSRQTGGTGLGLAIVKAVVERHGGSVTITSQEGQGTRAEVRLPGKPGLRTED